MLPDLSSEGMRHITLLVIDALGYPHHQCPQCKNAFAATCRLAHSWFYTRFDEDLGAEAVALGRPVAGGPFLAPAAPGAGGEG